MTEWVIHTLSVFLFSCTIVLIVPFIKVYTKGITDANYNVPLFAALLTIANMTHSLRSPYSIAILTSGHYKQTQRCYIADAAINIVISVVLVIKFGLAGVAIGTIAAMLYQTVWMAVYAYKNILHREIKHLFKQFSVDIVSVSVAYFATSWICLKSISYTAWLIMAVECAAIIGIAIFSSNSTSCTNR